MAIERKEKEDILRNVVGLSLKDPIIFRDQPNQAEKSDHSNAPVITEVLDGKEILQGEVAESAKSELIPESAEEDIQENTPKPWRPRTIRERPRPKLHDVDWLKDREAASSERPQEEKTEGKYVLRWVEADERGNVTNAAQTQRPNAPGLGDKLSDLLHHNDKKALEVLEEDPGHIIFDKKDAQNLKPQPEDDLGPAADPDMVEDDVNILRIPKTIDDEQNPITETSETFTLDKPTKEDVSTPGAETGAITVSHVDHVGGTDKVVLEAGEDNKHLFDDSKGLRARLEQLHGAPDDNAKGDPAESEYVEKPLDGDPRITVVTQSIAPTLGDKNEGIVLGSEEGNLEFHANDIQTEAKEEPWLVSAQPKVITPETHSHSQENEELPSMDTETAAHKPDLKLVGEETAEEEVMPEQKVEPQIKLNQIDETPTNSEAKIAKSQAEVSVETLGEIQAPGAEQQAETALNTNQSVETGVSRPPEVADLETKASIETEGVSEPQVENTAPITAEVAQSEQVETASASEVVEAADGGQEAPGAPEETSKEIPADQELQPELVGDEAANYALAEQEQESSIADIDDNQSKRGNWFLKLIGGKNAHDIHRATVIDDDRITAESLSEMGYRPKIDENKPAEEESLPKAA